MPLAELDHLGIFAVDIIIRLILAEERLQYLIRHWYDVLVPALSLLRPLRRNPGSDGFAHTASGSGGRASA
jgi:hypothetical protein